jgi:hypothetical protein
MRRGGWALQLLGGWLDRALPMVGEEASRAVSRAPPPPPLRRELPSESPMVRRVERDDCAESGGDLRLGEAPCRPWGAEASLMVAAERFECV